jgi:hypothetical protein
MIRKYLPLLLVFSVLVPGAARASHYPLNSIDLTTADENYKLYKAGITDTEALLKATSGKAAREALAKKLGLTTERLKELAETCDLLSMKGIGPTVAKLMRRCAVRTVKEMRTQKAADLYACMKKVNLKESVTELLPDAEYLQQWIDASVKAPSVVE